MEKNTKIGTFFFKEWKITQRSEHSFEKNGCPTLLDCKRWSISATPLTGIYLNFIDWTVDSKRGSKSATPLTGIYFNFTVSIA